MKRLLAVSDIHGELWRLENLLDEASYDPKKRPVNFTWRLHRQNDTEEGWNE